MNTHHNNNNTTNTTSTTNSTTRYLKRAGFDGFFKDQNSIINTTNNTTSTTNYTGYDGLIGQNSSESTTNTTTNNSNTVANKTETLSSSVHDPNTRNHVVQFDHLPMNEVISVTASSVYGEMGTTYFIASEQSKIVVHK
jgi:hypothetical protein